MTVLPGTQVQVRFYQFSGLYPPLYEARHQGSLNLASVNAGNSNGLCVGLGGVNGGFLDALTKAGQKRANLSPHQGCNPGAYDDYQDRHLQLLSKAAGATASAAYSNVDPCRFSYVNAAQVSNVAGWYEGVCFVDVFDSQLCPDGNPKNVAMLYVAPPCDSNYATPTAFLSAIEATASHIIRAIAGYNALAAQQQLPVIEALRNTLYSSNIYNQNLKVPAADIAGAILAGFAAELRLQPHCGLQELQFPVGSGTQGELFGSLQKALGGTPGPNPPNLPINVLPFEGDEVDPNNDDDPRSVEMDVIQSQGASAANLRVNAAKVEDAAAAVRRAVDQVDQILQQGGHIDPKSPYQRVQLPPASQYESPQSGLNTDNPYQVMVSPPVPTAAVFETAAGEEAGKVLDAADAARQAALQALDAATPTDLETHRAAVRTQAQAASEAADAADEAYADAARRYGSGHARTMAEKTGAEFARRACTQTNRLAETVDRFAARRRRLQAIQDQLDLVAYRKRVAKIIGGVAAFITAGGLLWGFVFGGGRKVVSAGVARFDIKDLEIDVADTVTSVDVDVPLENGELVLVKAVHLHDAQGQQVDQVDTADGSWVAVDKHIKYTAKRPAATVTVPYVLEAVGAPSAITDPAKLTIKFTPSNQMPAQATDVTVAASDRTSAVSIPVAAEFQYFGSTADAEGVWSQDATKKQAVFTPNAGVEVKAVLKTVAYRFGDTGSVAALAVLFPAAALSQDATNRSAQVAFPAAEIEVVLLRNGATVSGDLDATVKDTQGNDLKVGAWSGSGTRQLAFTPTALPDSLTQISVDYAVSRGGVNSKSGSATVNFPAVSVKPTAKDLSFTTADRTKPVTFALLNVQLSGATTTAEGAWTVDPVAGKVIFTPAATLANGMIRANVSYVVKEGNATSDPANLTVFLLPAKPADITRTSIARTVVTTVDVAAENPGVTAPYTVQLYAGALLDRLGNWSVNGKSLLFTPDGSRLTSSSVSVGYVLVAPDGTHTASATLQLDFSFLPVAYDIKLKGANRADVVQIPFLDYCVVPLGYQDVKSARLGQLATPDGATWEKGGVATKPEIIFRGGGTSANLFQLPYSVVDQSGNESNVATISIDFSLMKRFLPMAADFVVSSSVPAGTSVSADVLTRSSSFFPIDPKTVRLTGLQDILLDDVPASNATLQKDGKSLTVDGEGVWLVADTGEIAFQADAKLTRPPTPVSFCFADIHGNLSNHGVIAMDPELAGLAGFPAALTALTEQTFWSSFQQQVSNAQPALDSSLFLTVTTTLAGGLLAAGPVGPNPVAPAQFGAVYQAWIDGGQLWDDAPGTAKPVGLVPLCAGLVTTAAGPSASALSVRYWRLELMSRMVQMAMEAN